MLARKNLYVKFKIKRPESLNYYQQNIIKHLSHNISLSKYSSFIYTLKNWTEAFHRRHCYLLVSTVLLSSAINSTARSLTSLEECEQQNPS